MSPSSRMLSDELDVRQHYLRAAHIEHHQGQATAGYIPTARGLEVIHRITRAMAAPDAGRAWSLTGPYGAGKSSFALFLHALLGHSDNAATLTATQILSAAEPALADELAAGREAAKASAGGFIRAAATAQREPVTDTVLRALHAGAGSYWPGRRPRGLVQALADADQTRTPRAVADALAALAGYAPVILILDEFGKNLEHFADSPQVADLFVLQELAERCTGTSAIPAYIVTLQHLAFDDYVRTTSTVQRSEWGKIQGRFEDIPFVDGAEQAARLVAAAFTSNNSTPGFRKARSTWAANHAAQCSELGLLSMIPNGADAIADCYPLHPLTLLTLPDLCARFGQHGRTLFSFLTGREPHSVVEFLHDTASSTKLPSVGMSQLFDFFINSGGGTNPQRNARLTEVNTAIRETTGLTAGETHVLKTIGVLNLLSQGGPLRASQAVISYAMTAERHPDDIDAALCSLQDRGVLTYRAFADEYRLWQGSDLDLPAIVTVAREEIAGLSPAALLSEDHTMPPAIAGRHSQRVGMLRYFRTMFADPTTKTIARPTTTDDADGLVVYYLGEPKTAASLHFSDGSKPVLVVTTDHHHVITEAIIEMVAVGRALTRDDVRADHVARRELQDRAADAHQRVNHHLMTHLRPDAAGVEFHVVGEMHRRAVGALPRARSLSPLLSAVCDVVYSRSPEIRNEMVGRRELTSQAAKARRELLEAMVTHQREEWLGFTGYGPEKAMYAALLRHTEMHYDTGDGFAFGAPHGKHAGMSAAWHTAEKVIVEAGDDPVSLDAVYDALMAPPLGMTEGAIPVLLTALLLAHEDDIAVYQEGTYQPAITPDLLERLVKSPGRFSARHFAVSGTHGRVIAAVAAAVTHVTGREPAPVNRSRGRRNYALLRVAGPLLTFARSLPAYTLRTHRLSSDAEAVRDALLSTTEPETLMFRTLPAACGLTPFAAAARGRADDVVTFENRLVAAMEELHAAFGELLDDVVETVAAELRLSGELVELRTQLRGQVAPLVETLLEPRLRSFVLLAAQTELDDAAWVEALANNVIARPPESWRDDDVARFDVELRGLAGSYRRMLALHYDTLSAQRAGFDAHRVTMTNPDGTEHASVVWVDHTSRQHVEKVVQQAQAAVEKVLGSRGAEALLAVLAESVLGRRQDGAATQELPSTSAPKPVTTLRSARHG